MTDTSPIKVMIVDDELLVRKGLRETIAWDKYGMEVVADAPNGAVAWELCGEHEPHLIVTDIVMPHMDGIELTRAVKAAYPATRVLFLSCHNDFAYAQEGMKLGACGYLLKTAFDEQEWDAYLESTRRGIMQERRSLADRSVAQSAAKPDVTLYRALFAWLEKKGERPDLFHSRMRSEGLFSGQTGHVFYFYAEEGAGLLSEWKENLLKQAGSRHPAVWIGDEDRHAFLFCSKEVASLLEVKLQGGKDDKDPVRWLARGEIGGANRALEAAKVLYLTRLYADKYAISAEEWPEPIVRAIEYMEERVEAFLTVPDVAAKVGLSRSYFSVLFKKTVGESFLSFYYRLKLDRACRLLSTTDWRLQEISDSVGIPDSKYFSKWFRKEAGCTPSEYRERTKIR